VPAFVVAAVAALVVAAASAAPPAGSPDLAAIAVGTADLQGARASHQGYEKAQGEVAAYSRGFKPGAGIGHSATLLLESGLDVFSTPGDGHALFMLERGIFRSAAGRKAVSKTLIAEIEKGAKVKGTSKVTFGRMLSLGIGDETFVQPLTITVRKVVKTPFVVSMTRRDRVVSTLLVMGQPGGKLAPADIARLQGTVATRIADALAPLATTPPSVTGTAALGQTLTGSEGIWINSPTLTRSWLRCDATGNACAPVAGATTSTYVLAQADVGFTIRYSVIGMNSISTATATSTQTAVVAAAPPPAG
jgi:hypothetical protein